MIRFASMGKGQSEAASVVGAASLFLFSIKNYGMVIGEQITCWARFALLTLYKYPNKQDGADHEQNA